MKAEERPKEDFEKSIEDLSEISGHEFKFTPDYFIFATAARLPAAISNTDPKVGFLQYRTLVLHFEMLMDAAGKLPNDYEEQLKEFTRKEKYISKKDNEGAQGMLMAMEQAKHLHREMFKLKTATGNLRG